MKQVQVTLTVAFAAATIFSSVAFAQSAADPDPPYPANCAQVQSRKNGEQNLPGITGAVLLRDGKPARSAKILLEDESGRTFGKRTSAEGCFRIEGIVPGKIYHVEVRHKAGKWQASVRTFDDGDRLVLKAIR